MMEMQNIKVTLINKDSGECLVFPDNYNIRDDTTANYDVCLKNKGTSIKNCREDENIKENKHIKNIDNNDFTIQHVGFNNALIKEETYEYRNIINYGVNTNNSIKNTSNLKENNTPSYIKEFDFFLKNYKENYDNYSTYSTITPSISFVSESEVTTNDIKHENLEKMPASTKLCKKFETDLHKQNTCESDEIVRNTTDQSCTEHIVNSMTETVKLSKPFHAKIELNYEKEVRNHRHSNNFFDDLTDMVQNGEVCDDESRSSSISELSIFDSIQIDPSANYSISSLNTMGLGLINQFETDVEDTEGYNSSDFEFIDEQEACLGSITTKSSDGIKFKNLSHVKLEPIQEHRVNFDLPGPSRLEDGELEEHRINFDYLDTNRRRYGKSERNSSVSSITARSNSDLEPEKHNNYVIPEGEHLYELFAEPWPAFDYQADNKAFFSNSAMHLDVDNIGFNIEMLHRRHQENEVNDALQDEALENAQRILTMYPNENTKRRRRC